MFRHRKLLPILSIIIILTMVTSGFPLQSASAQKEDGIKRERNAQTGKVSFIGPQSGRKVAASKALGIAPSARPADPGRALIKHFGPEFGLKDPIGDLTESKTRRSNDGHLSIRYQQNYQGVPVLGGELLVNTNDGGDLYSMSGEVSPDLSFSTQPTVDPGQAQQAALTGAAEWHQGAPEKFVASAPELWIYDESLLRQSTRPAELVWRMEVTAVNQRQPIRELVLVNAQSGRISLHFNQVDTAWGAGRMKSSRADSAPLAAPSQVAKNSVSLQTGDVHVKTYTGNDDPNVHPQDNLLCDQLVSAVESCTGGVNLNADKAQEYAIGVYQFYLDSFERNSIDDNNMDIISTVDYCDPEDNCPFDNAYWFNGQMFYGSASTYARADDIVAHELTHGVTEHESNLFYYYQSGAINESFSDLWGEYYDQTNGVGTDTGVAWLIGEDVTGDYTGPMRSMSNPPAYGYFNDAGVFHDDPDRMSSLDYRTDAGDSGGVHSNSGINNKAVYLMVEGNTFNGITVSGIGWEKTAAIYYEVAANNRLTSGSDYSDLYYALQGACSFLIGTHEIDAGDCDQVKNALDAVEMNEQPALDPGFNTDAPYCDTSDPVAIVFSDNLDSPSWVNNWAFSPTSGRWQRDSSFYGPYATSGTHSLYADDFPDQVTNAIATLRSLTIPQNAYLRFAHAYDFEADDPDYYDGGVLEYRIGSSGSWVDAGDLMDTNKYDAEIYTGAGNPLAGRQAFAGLSHGYISTRLNLGSLAGKTVNFRWRMGLDEAGASQGWWVDDVEIYQCQDLVVPGAVTGLAAAPGTADGTVDLSWIAPADDAGVDISGSVTAYEVKYSDTPVADWSVGGASYTTNLPTPVAPGALQTLTVSGLSPGTDYYFAVRTEDDQSNFSAYVSTPANVTAQFTTADSLGAPRLTSPTNRAILNDATPLLDWMDHAPVAAYYRVQVSTTSNFADGTRIYNELPSDSQFQVPSGLTSGTMYYWRVSAYDFLDQQAVWSAARTFTIDTVAPAAPTLRLPANDASVRSVPIFRWNAAAGAVLYQFQLDNDADCSSPFVSVEQRTLSRKPAGGLRGTYFWRVRAKDAAGNWSDWSSIYTVTITPNTRTR